jgi:hypothetical protein
MYSFPAMTPCHRFSGNESAHARQRAARSRDRRTPNVRVVICRCRMTRLPDRLFGVPVVATVSEAVGVGHVLSCDAVVLETGTPSVGVQ